MSIKRHIKLRLELTENHFQPRSGNKKVARRETSGIENINFPRIEDARRISCAPSGREIIIPFYQRLRSPSANLPLATFLLHLRRKNKHFQLAQVVKFLVLAFLLSFAACKSSQTSEEKSLSTREVIDDAGRQIQVPQKLTRVVSLSPHLTEIVFAVGGEGELVGVTSYCDYPAKAKTLPQVGDTIQPEIKRIVELKPQLVLVSTTAQMKEFRKQMEEANIPFYITNPRNLEGVFRTIINIGDLLGQKSNAEKLVADMRSRARAIEERVKDKQVVPVFYQISPEPVFTAGRDSYITDIIRIAGGQNVAAAMPEVWTPVKDTSNFLAQPEAIIIPVSGAATKKKLDVAPFLQNSAAVTNNRVYGINDYLLARPGPRIIDGLEELARVLQPEAFK